MKHARISIKRKFFSYFPTFFLVATLLLLLGVLSQRQTFIQHAATTHQIKIVRYTMDPEHLTIHVGDTVTWTNLDDDPHDAHSNTEVFQSPLLNKGQSYSFTFTQPGVFEYYCTPHKSMMKGYTITVLPADTPTNVPPTVTPTKTPTLPPTAVPTKVPTVIPPTTVPTQRPTPTVIPSATNTPPSAPMKLEFSIFLHGIGQAGDNINSTNFSLSNKNPQQTQREVTIIVGDSAKNTVLEKSGTVIYDPSSGSYKGTLDVGTTLPVGAYAIKVKMVNYLQRLITVQQITNENINTIPPLYLITGDVDNNNVLDTRDYNMVLSCINDLLQNSCSPTQKKSLDLNDDGSINPMDLNLLLREFSVRNGD